jgi:hypothetical protein
MRRRSKPFLTKQKIAGLSAQLRIADINRHDMRRTGRDRQRRRRGRDRDEGQLDPREPEYQEGCK